MNLKEELKTIPSETLINISKKLDKELINVKNGKQRNFHISEYLTINNIAYVELLHNNFYNQLEKMNIKAKKFRDNPGNLDKYGLNQKKINTQKEQEYINLAYPTITDNLWEVEVEIKLIKQALK